MRKIPTYEEIKAIKRLYPCGTRVQLVYMHDIIRSIPRGMHGTVIAIDPIGTIIVEWDNGRKLGIVYGHDIISEIKE